MRTVGDLTTRDVVQVVGCTPSAVRQGVFHGGSCSAAAQQAYAADGLGRHRVCKGGAFGARTRPAALHPRLMRVSSGSSDQTDSRLTALTAWLSRSLAADHTAREEPTSTPWRGTMRGAKGPAA